MGSIFDMMAGGNYGDRDRASSILEAAGIIPAKEARSAPAKALPDEVAVALNFIRLCNENMGMRGFGGVNKVEMKEQRLHTSQEDVFKSACRVVRNYFDSFTQQERQGVLGLGRSRTDVGTATVPSRGDSGQPAESGQSAEPGLESARKAEEGHGP